MGDDGFLLEVGLVAVLILLNGFFAGAEIAVISAPGARVQARAGAGDRSAQTLLKLKSDPDRFLATVQIGVTLVGTLASAVRGVAAMERLEPLFASLPSPWLKTLAEPLAVATVVFTIAYLSLVVGELVPKSLAMRHSEISALGVARPIDWLSRLSAPVVSVLTASSKVFLALLRQKADAVSPFHTLDDLSHSKTSSKSSWATSRTSTTPPHQPPDSSPTDRRGRRQPLAPPPQRRVRSAAARILQVCHCRRARPRPPGLRPDWW
jgi:magnesium and cobalt exporter, CNNM family